jgi:hypothetical protein
MNIPAVAGIAACKENPTPIASPHLIQRVRNHLQEDPPD